MATSIENISLIDIETIAEHRYPGRAFAVDLKAVEVAAASIVRIGLQQPIVIRNSLDGKLPYEVMVGKKELKAFRSLHLHRWHDLGKESPYYEASTGVTKVPAIVRTMSDREAVLAALSQDGYIASLNWKRETEALLKAFESIDDLTHSELAQVLGIKPSELRDRFRLLSLPKSILRFINQDVLHWRDARQLLAFSHQTHCHEKELTDIAKRLHALTKATWFPGRLTEMSVRRKIWETLFQSNMSGDWQQFGEPMAIYEIVKDTPLFDVAEFKFFHAERLHKIPTSWKKGAGTVVMTCAGKEWLAAQESAKTALGMDEVADDEAADVLAEQAESSVRDEVNEFAVQNEPRDELMGYRVLPPCAEGLPADIDGHWHFEYPDPWGAEGLIYQSPAFIDPADPPPLPSMLDKKQRALSWHEHYRAGDTAKSASA